MSFKLRAMRQIGRSLLMIGAAVCLSGCFARATAGSGTLTPSAVTPTVAPQPPTQQEQPTSTGLQPVNPSAPPTVTPEIVAQQPTPTIAGPSPSIPPTQMVQPLADAVRLWAAPNVPVALLNALQAVTASGRYTIVASPDQAQVTLGSIPAGASTPLSARWIYVPVVPFASVADNLTVADIQRFWRGDTAALAYLSDNGQVPTLVTTAPILFWLTGGLGPAAANVPIQTVLPEQLAPRVWEIRPAWSLVPFELVNPTLKVLKIDGQDVFSRALPIEQYPLQETFGFGGDPALSAQVAQDIAATGLWPSTNRDPQRLTSLIMTGVTALTRVTAWKMETQGINYPARDILPFFAEADILHTSNEVSFAKNCPAPNPNSTSTVFCSRESYFDLLKTIGLDVVELTGNHVNDWGVAALSNSLDMYDANQMAHFGGGRNTDDARKAAIVEHNGNRIAFLGCNPVGPRGAWAGADRPGSAICDDGFLAQEIPRLRNEGNLVVMTLQYQEYYQYNAPPAMQAFFRKYTAMGANVVMGSQAHQPHGFNFPYWENSFIHFGLGNLFFDQMWSTGTRQMFADKLIIYAGGLVSVQLFTGLIEDYARPRPMSDAERAAFLRVIFKATGW